MPSSNETLHVTSVARDAPPASVSLLALLNAFLRLGTITFGGSVQSWTHREIVQRLRWLDDKTFLSGLTVAQVLPGPNPVNIAIYVGLQLHGALGAVVAVLGMILPSLCVMTCLGYVYYKFGYLVVVHFILTGLAASGVGATLSVGIKMARRLPNDWVAPLTAIAVFAVVGVLRWPLVPVVLVIVPLSIFWAYTAERRAVQND
jgi:chromate transporter